MHKTRINCSTVLTLDHTFAQLSTHEQDQPCEMTVTLHSIQIHSCTFAEEQSVVKPFYLTAVPTRLQSYLLLFFLLTTCTFFNMLQHLEDLRDEGKWRISYSSPVKMHVMHSITLLLMETDPRATPVRATYLHNLQEVTVIWVPPLCRSHPF